MNKSRLVIVGIFVLMVFGFGFYFASLQHDSRSLKQINQLNRETNRHQLVINNKSHELEIKLQQVKTYERQNHKKTQAAGDATNSNCISSDFVELFNQQTAEYENILSTKHVDEMR
ncbi:MULTISPECIES: hypothetical protein [unclassified Gilliamella]|uniref:hypothetical protein n=1 Tax=unclassified Gilliamella TaxID=2685620 RepID=UPI00226A9FB3|nr:MULTISPECIES: hypothetical protein [unclassified Gilliamella]MCX8587295.1 hypothetical protein [Gilliamella sp. B3801]MCX8591950.1 hypothetical protein [Gilliamella sp. B3804]